MLRETDHKTGNAYLRPHIKELRNHSLNKVCLGKDTVAGCRGEFPRVFCSLRHVGQMREVNENSNDKEDSSNQQVRQLHRACLISTVGLRLRGAHDCEL